MAVQSDPFQITPFTSTVPLVQTPPDVMGQQTRPAQPLSGEFGKRGTGAMAIGDSLLKGFMAGHQQKEQRKNAQAQTAIAAADGMRESAYQNYQQNLQKLGPQPDQNDPKFQQWKQQADGFYSDYAGVVQKSKEAIAPYVIPEKTPKGQQKKGEKGEKKTGWNNFQDFFAANPHIVPSLGLMAIQPKPPGLAPQAQEQVQNLETNRLANEQKQRQLQNEKTYQEGFTTFAHLSPTEIASLPPDAKKGYAAWQNARAAITPLKYSGTAKLYDVGNGKKAYLYPEEAAQYYPNAQPVDPTAPKPGSPAELEDKYFQSIGITRADATADQLAAATQYAKAAGIVPTTTTSGTTVDPQGNRTSTSTRTAKPGGISKPPTASAAPTGITAPPTAKKTATSQQGISKPPQAGKTAQGGITPPPRGKETALTASVTRQATKAQQEGYQKAESTYAAAADKADQAWQTAVRDAKGDPDLIKSADAVRDAAKQLAIAQREAAKVAVKTEYDAAVKSIGGTPGSETTTGNLPPGWQ